ncbi:MAG: AMP-binding protein [Rubrivivax sp.]|nr:AMP-binding protein [Rubrivivax sp.]
MSRLILDHVLDHEANRAGQVFFTQPTGGGNVVDYTWGQVVGEARRMAAHLQSLGLPRGARVAILSKNCAHFIMAELAIWLGGYTTVAIFPTETAETIQYVLGHSESSALFVGKLDTWPAQQPGVPKGMPCIAFPLAPAEAKRDFEGWDAIVARTAPLAGRITRGADELAMLIYTSGSTGTPKGVMNTFGAFSWAAAAAADFARQRVGANAERRVISYLPLAHSFERTWIEGATLVEGTTQMFFADTLASFVEDVKRARPTLFISVPRLWLKFQQGVFSKMPPAKLERLLKIPILGRIVAKKVLAGLGLDAVIYAGSGSAPLPPELIKWYLRLGLKLGEGYGMTEDNSVSHTSLLEVPGAAEPGWVGVPMKGVEVKLSDEGEVLIKSPGQFSGYYKQPELTAASFTEDGFFRTGDLGERRPNGLLKITGRAKELFKTAKGKYVAPAPIENRLLAHPLVESCMVSGVGMSAAYALVVPAEEMRPRLADPAAREQFEGEMAALLERVNGEVADYEQLAMLVLAREAWTIESGTLTPTMKIKRSRIEANVAPSVEGWYAARKPVLWA